MNLCRDRHMKRLTSYPANEPVSLAEIHTFQRMQGWKMDDIIAALRTSEKLELVEPTDDEAGYKVKSKVLLSELKETEAQRKMDDADFWHNYCDARTVATYGWPRPNSYSLALLEHKYQPFGVFGVRFECLPRQSKEHADIDLIFEEPSGVEAFMKGEKPTFENAPDVRYITKIQLRRNEEKDGIIRKRRDPRDKYRMGYHAIQKGRQPYRHSEDGRRRQQNDRKRDRSASREAEDGHRRQRQRQD
jgi:hypothetical protein